MPSLQEALASENADPGGASVRVEGSPSFQPPHGHGWSYDPGGRNWFLVKHTPWGLWDRPLG